MKKVRFESNGNVSKSKNEEIIMVSQTLFIQLMLLAWFYDYFSNVLFINDY